MRSFIPFAPEACVGAIILVLLGNIVFMADRHDAAKQENLPVVSRNTTDPLLEFAVDGRKVSAWVTPVFYGNHAVGDVLPVTIIRGNLSGHITVEVDMSNSPRT